LSEIAQEGAKVGGYIPVPLDLQEMGLPIYLHKSCRSRLAHQLLRGLEELSLATVTHLNDDVFHLTLTTLEGRAR